MVMSVARYAVCITTRASEAMNLGVLQNSWQQKITPEACGDHSDYFRLRAENRIAYVS
jgi:hypothetical protein